MNPNNLAAINKAQAEANLSNVRHQELLAHTGNVSDTVLSSTEALIKYLEGHVTKTEVINQLQEIATPDVQYVVQALQVLDETIKSQPTTDLGQITALMTSLVEEARAIPKELPTLPEAPEQVDYTERFESLTTAIEAVTAAVEAQAVTVEAPVVNVQAPQVNVDAPDLTPIQSSLVDVTKAVKAIVIPEYKTDNSEVEKLLKKSNKLLDQILDKPVGGGGGGGAGIPAFRNAQGHPDQPVIVQGAVPYVNAPLAQRVATTGTITYIGKAAPGTLDADPNWQIQKVDETSGTVITFADGDAAYNNIWTDRATLTYI